MPVTNQGNQAVVCKASNASELMDLLPSILPTPEAWIQTWKSPEAFAAHMAAAERSQAWCDGAWETRANESAWHGSKNMPAACELAFTGWPEGAERVEALRDRILISRPVLPAIVKWDVAGAVPSVPRLLAGNPLHMRRMQSASTRRRPVITLVVEFWVNSGCSSEYLARRAATVAAVTDLIEDAGYSVHVVGTSVCSINSFGAYILVTCKEPHEHADVGRLAFGIGHASMLRRFCFGSMGYHRDARKISTLMGMKLAWKPDAETMARNVFILDKPDAHDFHSDDWAVTKGVERMIETLKAQGCPAFRDDAAA